MEFYRPSKRALNVPIVPLIDILTILLIFLVVTQGQPKKPTRPRPILQIDLPTVRNVPSTTTTETRAVLAVAADGTIMIDNYELASPDLLTDALIVFQEKNPGRKLELAADQGVRLAQLFMVWDALTAAGIEIKDVPARIKLPADVPFVDPLQR
jgi:biopolymer transport protein ExbD